MLNSGGEGGRCAEQGTTICMRGHLLGSPLLRPGVLQTYHWYSVKKIREIHKVAEDTADAMSRPLPRTIPAGFMANPRPKDPVGGFSGGTINLRRGTNPMRFERDDADSGCSAEKLRCAPLAGSSQSNRCAGLAGLCCRPAGLLVRSAASSRRWTVVRWTGAQPRGDA